MATLDELSTALRNADAAGDVDAARALAGEITKMRGGKIGLGDVARQALTDVTSLPSKIYNSLKTLPARAYGASEAMREEGVLNPAPLMESAMLASPVPTAMRVGERAIPGVAKAEGGPQIPTTTQLSDAAGAGFNAARSMDVRIDPRARQTLAAMLERQYQNKGILPENADIAYKTLGRLQTPADEGAFTTIADLHNIRQAFGNAAGNISSPKDPLAGVLGKQLVDKYLEALPQQSVMAGPATAARDQLKAAIGNEAAAQRSNQITGELNKAYTGVAERPDLAAGSSGVGQNVGNSTRQQVKSIVTDPDRVKGWTPAEIEQGAGIVRGTRPMNAARFFGNALGGSNAGLAALYGMSGAGAGIGSGNPLAAALAAAPIVGYGLKQAEHALTRREVNKLDEALRSRSPLAGSMPPAALTGAEEARRMALIRALGLDQQ